MMTFEEFRKSGRNVRFSDVGKFDEVIAEFGRIYDGNCHIELMSTGQWMVSICNEEYIGDLPLLEKRLYEDWYVLEHSKNPTVKRMFRDVLKTIDACEGIGGPTGNDYVKLMIDIAAECNNRLHNYFDSPMYYQDVKNS